MLKTFHKKRPPGHGIDSRIVHDGLPAKLRRKIGRRTVRRRLAEKGYKPEQKVEKNDPNKTLRDRRLAFCRAHRHRTGANWCNFIQACGDAHEHRYYPRSLKPRFDRYKAAWTYMKKDEKYKAPFLRPKRWFARKDWSLTRPFRVLGFTTSNGKCFACPAPDWTSEGFARLIRQKVGPFLRRAFPGREHFQVLLDSEGLMHAPPAKAALRDAGITVLPGWPRYSPELNPQENLWSWVEKKRLPEVEKRADTFKQPRP